MWYPVLLSTLLMDHATEVKPARLDRVFAMLEFRPWADEWEKSSQYYR